MVPEPYPLNNYSIIDNIHVGFAMLTFVNQTTLLWQHFNSSDGETLDYMYLMKDYLIVPESSVSWVIIAATITILTLILILLIYCVRIGASKINTDDKIQQSQRISLTQV